MLTICSLPTLPYTQQQTNIKNPTIPYRIFPILRCQMRSQKRESRHTATMSSISPKNTPPAKKISFVPKYSDASAPQKNPVITSTTNFIPHPVSFRFNRHALPYSRSLPHKNFLICQLSLLTFFSAFSSYISFSACFI